MSPICQVVFAYLSLHFEIASISGLEISGDSEQYKLFCKKETMIGKM